MVFTNLVGVSISHRQRYRYDARFDFRMPETEYEIIIWEN